MKNIKLKSSRQIQARKTPKESAWLGLGFFGLIGWSIIAPTLLGAGLGIWLDQNFPDSRSWTLVFLITGLIIGCFTAYNWIFQEYKKMQDAEEHKD